MKLWTIHVEMGVLKSVGGYNFIWKPITKWFGDDPHFGSHFRTLGTSFTKFGTSFIKFGTFDPTASETPISTWMAHNLIYVKIVLHYGRNDCPNIFFLQHMTCKYFKINDSWNIFLLQPYIRYMYIGFHILWESGQEYIPNLHYVGLMYQTVVHGNLFERDRKSVV